MNKKSKYTDWDREFFEFDGTRPVTPPSHLSKTIRLSVMKDLKRFIWKSIAKFAFIQTAVACLTLFLCPQFKIGFTKYDLLATLVQHHEGIGFMVFCGLFFLGGGALIAPFFLTQSEVNVIEKTKWFYFPLAAFTALLAFYLMGPEIVLSHSLSWLSGGTAGGIIGFETARKIRSANILS